MRIEVEFSNDVAVFLNQYKWIAKCITLVSEHVFATVKIEKIAFSTMFSLATTCTLSNGIYSSTDTSTAFVPNMSRDMTKPTMWLCAQRRLRSAWASAQSDQSLRCALNG